MIAATRSRPNSAATSRPGPFEPVLRAALWTGPKGTRSPLRPPHRRPRRRLDRSARKRRPGRERGSQIVSRYLAPFLDEMAGTLR